MPDDKKPDELDDIESILDRFLERRIFGAVGPRYRSLALIASLLLGTYTAMRKCPEAGPTAPQIASQGPAGAPAQATSPASATGAAGSGVAYRVPGLR